MCKSVGPLVLLVSHAWRLAASWLSWYDLIWDDWDDLALPNFVSSFGRLAQVGLMAESEEKGSGSAGSSGKLALSPHDQPSNDE